MGRIRIVILASGYLLLCGLCLSLPHQAQPQGASPTAWRCPSLPETFQEGDLVGTWRAEYGNSIDTLIIRTDGKYRQIYTCDACGYSFEDGWNRWWLERRPSGGLYLHLEAMHRCDNTDELCRQGEGGGEYAYWDFCEDRLVEMPGEVVLMVTGVPEGYPPAPRGIWLWHMAPSPGSGAFHFTLQEE